MPPYLETSIGKRQTFAIPTQEPTAAIIKPHWDLKPSCFCKLLVVFSIFTLRSIWQPYAWHKGCLFLYRPQAAG